MNIQCISMRPNHIDVIYGTGVWEMGEVKEVPDDLGKKMMQHPDVYTKQEPVPGAPIIKVKATILNEDPLQEFYDSLAAMNKEQMKTFIETKYNLKLDMRQFPTEQRIRDHARMLVEQYGLN